MGAFHFSSLPWKCLGSVLGANVETSAYGTNSITVVMTRQSQSLPRCLLITGKCSLFFFEERFWCRLGGTSRQPSVETLCNVSFVLVLESTDNNGGAVLSCYLSHNHLVVNVVNCLLFDAAPVNERSSPQNNDGSSAFTEKPTVVL